MVAVGPAWEVGGDFHWEAASPGPALSLPDPSVLFSMGRGIMLTIAAAHVAADSGRFFVPDYFCPETLLPLREAGVHLGTYADRPGNAAPEWESLDAKTGDVVMAVNFFGAGDGMAWQTWTRANPGVVLLEDHTHDPWSVWASASTADYAFASLRKSMPIPDGAVLWSPRGRPLYSAPVCVDSRGADAKLEGMHIKAAYLAGDKNVEKLTFRTLQLEGERRMADARTWGISPTSAARIEAGLPVAWRMQRAENLRQFLSLTAHADTFVPLAPRAPAPGVPFNAPVLFGSETERDAAHAHLTQAQVYCPIHWQLHEASEASLQMSRRILTVPLDHRVGANDVIRIAAILTDVGR